jgi:antitoxin CptB
MDIMTSIESRIKRAKFRANHRGTKEMDFVLGRYADAEAGGMNEARLGVFEELLSSPDPEIDGWIKGTGSPPALIDIISEIRRFHRLES